MICLHTVRNFLNKTQVKDRGLFAEHLERIYRAETEEKAKDGILRLKGIYTTNELERLAKEIKRRMKVIEVFPDEGSAERLLYLILKELNDRLNSKRLRGFNEIEWRK